MKLIIGIDPGMTGAVACIHGNEVGVWGFSPSADGKRILIPIDTSARVESMMWGADGVHVFIEDINAIPTFGAQTSFKMGRALGTLEQWVARYPNVSIEYVKPLKWKKAFGLVLSKEQNANEKKRVSLECARRLFPQVDLHRVADHNKAEALLIAEYGRRIIG